MVVTIIIIVFYWFMIDIMLSLATSMGNNAVVTTGLFIKNKVKKSIPAALTTLFIYFSILVTLD